MNSQPFDDPAYWYERGAEARAIAAEMRDPETKRMMLGVAATYDRLAEHAERRMAAETKT